VQKNPTEQRTASKRRVVQCHGRFAKRLFAKSTPVIRKKTSASRLADVFRFRLAPAVPNSLPSNGLTARLI
jgi:hypothetical protein